MVNHPRAISLGHWHPGESPGRVSRAETASVDDKLRGLNDG